MFGAIWEHLDIYVAYVGCGLVNIDGYTRPFEIDSSVSKRGKDSNKQKSMISVKVQKSVLWYKNQYSWQKTSVPH